MVKRESYFCNQPFSGCVAEKIVSSQRYIERGFDRMDINYKMRDKEHKLAGQGFEWSDLAMKLALL